MKWLMHKSPRCSDLQDPGARDVLEEKLKGIMRKQLERSPRCGNLEKLERESSLLFRRSELPNLGVTPPTVTLEENVDVVTCRIS